MQLYAVVAKVILNDITEAISIFKEYGKEKYYTFRCDEKGEIKEIKQVDITRYGSEKYLPLSKVDIAYGGEYLIKWNAERLLSGLRGLLDKHEIECLSIQEWIDKNVIIMLK